MKNSDITLDRIGLLAIELLTGSIRPSDIKSHADLLALIETLKVSLSVTDEAEFAYVGDGARSIISSLLAALETERWKYSN